MERAFWNVSTDTERAIRQFRPRCDVYETPENVVVHAEMPGVKKEDIKVELHQDQLSISAKSMLLKKRPKVIVNYLSVITVHSRELSLFPRMSMLRLSRPNMKMACLKSRFLK